MKKLILPLLIGTLVCHSQANDDFTYSADGQIIADATAGDDTYQTLKESYVSLSADWQDKIRAIVTAKIGDFFDENSIDFNEDFDVEEFVEEAFIEIRNVGNMPVAVIVGKRSIPFGQSVQSMPIQGNSKTKELQEISEVFGLTLDLNVDDLDYFDRIELASFESKGGDLSVGKLDSLAFRVSKVINDQFFLNLSYARLGNKDTNLDAESRTSVGIIGSNEEGDILGWIEGIHFSDNPEYKNSNYAINVGFDKEFSDTMTFTGEYSYVDNEVHSVGVGIKKRLSDNMEIGAEVRYNDYVHRKNDTVFGFTFKYMFGYSSRDNYVYESDLDEDYYYEDDEYYYDEDEFE